MTGGEAVVAVAMVDAEGRLVSADPAILTLNARAGGKIGAPVAVPQLATIARLARRLGIVISRSVHVADEDADIDLWVRAQPEDALVRLAVSGWHERRAWQPVDRRPAAELAVIAADSDWHWESDAGLTFSHLPVAAGARHGFDAGLLLGRPLDLLFGGPAIGDRLTARQSFVGVEALLLPGGQDLEVSAVARFDGPGRFAGYAGGVRMKSAAVPSPVEDGVPATFARRLERALRLPLGRIIANADSISAQTEGPVAPDYAAYASDIASAGRHLMALVDDLADLQAVERPDFVLPDEAIDLADLARRAAGLLGVRADAAGVVVMRPPFEARMPARGDFRRVLQILVNVIGNAIRYAPRGSAILLSLGEADGLASVRVIDRGKGIAAADQLRIFDKFERVDSSEVGGNGLGLYIARRLARAMGGDLSVDSVVGEGACFTLTLPADAAARENQR